MTPSNNIDKFTEATGDDIYDADFAEHNNGNPWMVEATETKESIEDFIASSKTWNESSKPELGEINGLPFVFFPNLQVAKGDKRISLSVVDFGDIRVALQNTDLTEF
jgi:hypothetical protein